MYLATNAIQEGPEREEKKRKEKSSARDAFRSDKRRRRHFIPLAAHLSPSQVYRPWQKGTKVKTVPSPFACIRGGRKICDLSYWRAGMSRTLTVSASPVNAPATNPATNPAGDAAPGPMPAAPGLARDAKRRRNNVRHRPDGDRPVASRPEDRLVIRLLQAVDVCFARIYHRVNVLAPQHLPKHGPAVLICNHISGLDPMLIQSVCPRLIVWMMAKEYYEIPGLRSVFKTVEAIPVERGGRDLAATRAALRALEAGRILGVFPEGKIETSRELLPFQTGVALMALKAGVPVYPAYLDGTQRGKTMVQAFLYPNVATLAFGPVVQTGATTTSKEVLQEVTDQYVAAVERLRNLTLRPGPGRRPVPVTPG